MEGDGVPYVVRNNENDIRNNNKNTPDTLNHVGIKATSIYQDVDYFRYHAPARLDDDDEIIDHGVANLSFTVDVPKDSCIVMEFIDDRFHFTKNWKLSRRQAIILFISPTCL